MSGIAIVILIAGVFLTNSRLEAQRDPTPDPLTVILAKLDEVLTAITGQTADLQNLQDSVNAVQTTVSGIPSVLLTPELTVVSKGFSCSVVNGGASDAEVVIALMANNGTVFSAATRVIPPDQTRSLRFAATSLGFVYCKVTVAQGDRRELRVALCAHEGTSTVNSACMAAVEGR
jgi:hypothetical protein